LPSFKTENLKMKSSWVSCLKIFGTLVMIIGLLQAVIYLKLMKHITKRTMIRRLITTRTSILMVKMVHLLVAKQKRGVGWLKTTRCPLLKVRGMAVHQKMMTCMI
ncbi:hypothetical protein BAE44_0002398, partial [Dichanthelium oligosanthes]